MNNEDLKPCPFCGYQPKFFLTSPRWFKLSNGHDRECILSAVSLGEYPNTEDYKNYVIKTWNRRVDWKPVGDNTEFENDKQYLIQTNIDNVYLCTAQNNGFTVNEVSYDGPVFLSDWDESPVCYQPITKAKS